MPSQSSSPSPEKGVAPAAMTERLIDAALTHERAGRATEKETRKALFAARSDVEAKLAQRDELLAAVKVRRQAVEHGLITHAHLWTLADALEVAAIARATEGV